MKALQALLYSAVLMMVLPACDAGFDELNTNEVQPTSVDPAFLLNRAIINCSPPGGVLIYEYGIVQQIVSPNSGVITGANYNQDNRNSTDDIWVALYPGVIRNTRDIISRVAADPDRNNLLQSARIIQAFAFMVLTDTYGDIPYFEGGKGFTEQINLPKYDSQEAIYADIIKELREATAALNPNGRKEVSEILYGGDIAKWKKLGYSLLLRAGMRLSKVDPGRAAQITAEAFQAGVMTENADNFVVRHDANYQNAVGNTLNGTERNNFYLVEAFVNYLKTNNDPRLAAIAVRYVGAKSGPDQTAALASNDPTVQIGMPMGHDNASIVGVAANLSLASFYDFSQLDRSRMGKQASSSFLVTAAQTQLLLAEAAQRGWVNINAGEAFGKGIRLHMEQLASYDAASTVSNTAIDEYLKNTTYDPAKGLQQINEQYWVASFLNGPEVFANFRRSGYPQLTPNPFPSKDISGDFIRRLTYPNSEISVNAANLSEATSRMGPDNLDTRVWWDKP